MSEWKKVKITFPTIKLGDFIEPIKTTVGNLEDTKLQAYGVTNKEGIVITGKEPSEDKSKYIVLENNCFAFNPYRINVGSIGLNDKNIEGCVSPAYVVFKTINGLIPKFLFYYLKSEFGNHLINWYGNRGGVRNALRYSDLCNIDIPDITKLNQLDILKKLNAITMQTDKLFSEIDKQKSYAKQLRQSVLQDAIEGKLTTDWRKSHPVEKGNPDYDAEALFQKIQEEKENQATGKKKSSEKLAEISDEEKPFPIPTGWKWVRLGEIAEILGGFAYDSTRFIQESKNLVLRLGNIRDDMIRFESNPVFITNELAKNTQAYQVMPKDILITMTGTRGKSDYLYTVLVTEEIFNNLFGYKLYVNQRLSSIRFSENSQYFDYPLKSVILKDEIFETATGSANQANIGKQALVNWKIPLPPLAEQTEIVRRVETQLDKINQLEQQIATREELTKQLMRGILKDAFEGER